MPLQSSVAEFNQCWLQKNNLTQQKQTCIRNKMYYNKKQTQKTKACFGHLL